MMFHQTDNGQTHSRQAYSEQAFSEPTNGKATNREPTSPGPKLEQVHAIQANVLLSGGMVAPPPRDDSGSAATTTGIEAAQRLDGAIASDRLTSTDIAPRPLDNPDPTMQPQAKQQLASVADTYLKALLQGDRDTASTLVLTAVENGVDIRDVYLHIFQAAQHEVGRLWQTDQITIAQEHFCTAATQMIMAQLYPQIFGAERNGRSMVLACIGSELHEMGARMVADFFEMDGWDTYYMGTDVEGDSLIGALLEKNADMFALSITMPEGLTQAERLIAQLRADSRTAQVPVLVGGGAFQSAPQAWRTLGADGFAADAQQALAVAKLLIPCGA